MTVAQTLTTGSLGAKLVDMEAMLATLWTGSSTSLSSFSNKNINDVFNSSLHQECPVTGCNCKCLAIDFPCGSSV